MIRASSPRPLASVKISTASPERVVPKGARSIRGAAESWVPAACSLN
jgi:hypothetical protein